MRKVLGVYSAPRPHWVGDGFPGRSLFSHASHGDHVSPFVLFDYAGSVEFASADKPRGVGTHPHRGFETVTIVYKGEVEHRDSTGKGGIIGPGDVQWMTAAGGILHKEFHSEEFTRKGGTLEMVQLWVNLPAKHKNTAPGYQTLLKQEHPVGAAAESRRNAAGDRRRV
jgi:redox-sensitive bicupin YhaK (pirin superfamily)